MIYEKLNGKHIIANSSLVSDIYCLRVMFQDHVNCHRSPTFNVVAFKTKQLTKDTLIPNSYVNQPNEQIQFIKLQKRNPQG